MDQPNATLDFGVDGATQTVPVGFRDRAGTAIGNDIEVLTYTFRHTYPGANTYKVSFREDNRNALVVNMTNSVNTAFYVETEFTINPNLGLNNSVVLRNPPIDRATVVGSGSATIRLLFDPDGDSLSFRLVVPFQRLNTPVLAYIAPKCSDAIGHSRKWQWCACLYHQCHHRRNLLGCTRTQKAGWGHHYRHRPH